MTSNLTPNKSDMRNGILFIPDISGYSRFVKETDATEGATVIASLLDALIGANRLAFEISEIEGDAILFYRHGKPYSVNLILRQFERMIKSFNDVKNTLSKSHPQVSHLSLKLIVHYGPIATFSVRGFSKLYGSAVVEAHRLLKNNVDSNSYVLITDAYFQASINKLTLDEKTVSQCEIYSDVGELCYTFFKN